MFFHAMGAGHCPANVKGWGHTVGPDLVSWTREPASGVCGASGGGITLPNGFRCPNGSPWLSANIASACSSAQTGLHLFTITDHALYNYSRYQHRNKRSDFAASVKSGT
jgi:hypothetical protein